MTIDPAVLEKAREVLEAVDEHTDITRSALAAAGAVFWNAALDKAAEAAFSACTNTHQNDHLCVYCQRIHDAIDPLKVQPHD